jgi:hypothetical protein
MQKISSGTQELTKVKKQKSPDFLTSRFLNLLSEVIAKVFKNGIAALRSQ